MISLKTNLFIVLNYMQRTFYKPKIKITEISREILSNTDATTLFLANNSITSIPAEIGNLTNLTEMSLSNNKITSIPEELGKLTNLTELSFSKNEITYIPPDIGNLTNLTNLTFLNNKIISIPPDIGKLTNLTKLNFSGNQLTFLPDEIGKLVNLTHLNVSENKITLLPDSITKLVHLEELLVNDNMLDARALSIVTALSKGLVSPNKEIFKLSIINNPIIFPVDETMMAATATDIVYVSILMHGIIPLNSENQVIESELPTSVTTFEIQRVCSLSAINRVDTAQTEKFASLIKSQFEKPDKCSSGECSFDTEFTESCKNIEGDIKCELINTIDPQDKRFVDRYSLRYPKSKVFKKKYGTKVYYFNNKEYFEKGKGTKDWKIMMYIKKKDTILSFDITQHVIGENTQLIFFQSFLQFVVNGSTDFYGLYNEKPYITSIDNIVTFLNSRLGYKNIKIVDFSCGLFAKEEDIKNYKIRHDEELTEEQQSAIALHLEESHYGGRRKRKQKQSTWKQKRKQKQSTWKRSTWKRSTWKRITRKRSTRKRSTRKQSIRKQSTRKQSIRKNK
jgi:Leucine-rich repeat (LRR) protein